ncbi:MAG TPA: hypothetical protein VES64_09150 [Allosphingosinicella sp.]|nr:hypothetical protein [Allosphingosinicella sp.]
MSRAIGYAGFALIAAVAMPAPVAAFESRDLMCTAIRRAGTGFTYSAEPGLSVRALVRAPGPFVHGLGDDVVSFTCLRTQAMPEIDDVEVLQAGYELFLGSRGTGMRMIKLSLAGGRVAFEIDGGALSAGEQRNLTRIVAAMQARLDAAPPAPAAAPAS